MLNRRITWVHVGGHTFFKVWYQQTASYEIWGAQGFAHLTSYINKGSVNLDAYPYSETEKAASMLENNQIGLSWFDGNGRSIGDYAEATSGNPLKIEDFKEYAILPVFKYIDRWTGAVIAFAKAGARYTAEYGCGAYVHMGARYLYDANGDPLDSDYGRGFIATAAALWAETTGFNPGRDAKSEYDSVHGWYRKSGIMVHPTITGVSKEDSSYEFRISFALYTILKAEADDDTFTFNVGYANVHFYLGSLPAEWSDVTMKADLGNPDVSRQGEGKGFDLSGLYQESQIGLGLPAQSILWLASLAPDPIIQAICWGIEGVLLMSEWLNQWPNLYGYGINNYTEYNEFFYSPIIEYTVPGDGYVYEEVTSIIAVDVKVPTGGRTGWKILSLVYSVGIGTQNDWAEPYTEDTLEIAVWFDGGGQNDAGSGNDAGDTHASATSIIVASTYYGYLGGTDSTDWYRFYVESGKQVTVSMTPPIYADFDLELYSRYDSTNPKAGSHNGKGIEELLFYNIDSTNWWRIKIYRVSGSGVYSFHITLGGCPYVSA